MASGQAQILYLTRWGLMMLYLIKELLAIIRHLFFLIWENTPGKFTSIGNEAQFKASNNLSGNKVNFNPLPNAIISRTTFPKLVQAKRLRNTYLGKIFKSIRNRNVKSLVNLEFNSIFSPVWTNANADSFWVSVYNQAVVLEVYFSFFMDRSLNVLLKTCNVTLNGEIFSNLSESPSYSSISASDTSLSSNASSDDGFFFTKKGLRYTHAEIL